MSLHLFLRASIIALLAISFLPIKVSADTKPAPLKPPFSLKITFDYDQIRDIENKNDPVRLSYLLGYSDGMVISIDASGNVKGFAWIHSESSDGRQKTEGRLYLTGTYKSGKINGSWTYSGTNDIPQIQEFYFVTDRTFEGSGDFYSRGTIDKEGGNGYMTGEMEWTHEECDKQDTDTRSPTFGACLQKSFHVENESFDIHWTAVPVGDYCFNLRLKNDWEDSLTRFDAITGTIEITCDRNEVDWEPVMMSQIVYVGDHIASRDNSSAILHFEDMNTWIMKPNTEIVIHTPPEKETKIGLVMGRLWNNTKKLLFEGTMEIETTQAVAGIKGTTLVMETDGNTTTLKVISGTVEFTSTVTGDKVEVTSGQQISADSSGLGEISSFDVEAEIADWLTYVEDPSVIESSESVEFVPEDSFQSDAEVEEPSETGFFKKFWDKTVGRICAGIFPGMAAIILTFYSGKKKSQTRS